MSDRKTTIVATELGDVTVKKLALGDYAELLVLLGKLPKSLGDLLNQPEGSLTNEYLISMLPAIIAESLPEVAAILALTTDKDSEFIMQLDLAETTDIFAAAYELNDYTRVVANVKKVMARRAGTEQLPTPQT